MFGFVRVMDGKVIATCVVTLLVGVLIGGLIGHFASKESLGTSLKAQCSLISQPGNSISGLLTLEQEGSQVRITGNISGVPTGLHGFHIHQKAVLDDECASAGGHFNPFGNPHAGPKDSERHVGDLGNIKVESEENQTVEVIDGQISLVRSITGIAGRSIMIHSGEDDLGKGGNPGSKKTGNAGGRIACCNILLVS